MVRLFSLLMLLIVLQVVTATHSSAQVCGITIGGDQRYSDDGYYDAGRGVKVSCVEQNKRDPNSVPDSCKAYLERCGDDGVGRDDIDEYDAQQLEQQRLAALEQESCAGCAVAAAFMDGALNLSAAMNEKVGLAIRNFAVVIFVIWLLFQVGKMLLPFGPLEQSQKQLNLIVSKIGIMLVIVVGLQSLPVYERLLYGALDGVIGFSGLVLQASTAFSADITEASINSKIADGNVPEGVDPYRGVDADLRFDQGGFNKDEFEAKNQAIEVMDAPEPAGGVGSLTTEEMRTHMKISIEGQIRLVQSYVGEPICVALQLFGFQREQCFAKTSIAERTTNTDGTNPLWRFLKQIAEQTVAQFQVMNESIKVLERFSTNGSQVIQEFMLNTFAGVIILVVYGFIWLKYPLALLDVVLRWAVLLVLWPIVVITLAFPALRGTTATLLKGIANASITLIFQAVIVGVIISIITQIMVATDIDEFRIVATESEEVSNFLFQKGSYVMIIASGFLLIHLLKKAPEFAAVFINSTMDTRVAEGVWQQFTTYFWIAADAMTGGMTKARNMMPLK